MAILTKQPVKGVYVLGAIGYELIRFPLILIKYLLSYGRQHPEWTLRQALSVHIVCSAIKHMATIHVGTPLPLNPGSEKERFVLIQPAGDEKYQGPLRSNPDVRPVEIGATWYPAPLSAESDTSNVMVFLHIHGGAFVVGDGRPQATGYGAKKFLKHSTATHVFCPQYRLSTLPATKTSNPFPAALQDSLSSYLYLINDLKISPRNIVISGDSAGGNLIISLLRYLSEYGANLGIPNPSAALMWSPWINPSDVTSSFVHDNDHYASDYLSPQFTRWGTGAYAGLMGVESLKQLYITHKNRTFKTKVPMYLNTGGAEVLYYDDVEWAGEMKAAGNNITLDVEKNVPHDVVLMGNLLGFDAEVTQCAKRAGEWLKSITK